MDANIVINSEAPGFFFQDTESKETYFLWYPDLVKLVLNPDGHALTVEHSTGNLVIEGSGLRPLMLSLSKEEVQEIRLSLPVEAKKQPASPLVIPPVLVKKIVWRINDSL